MQFQKQMMGIPAARGKEYEPIPHSGSLDSGEDAIPVAQYYRQSFGAWILLRDGITGGTMGNRKKITGLSLYKENRSGSGSVAMTNQYIKIAHCTNTLFPSGELDPTGATAADVSLSNILTLTDETTVFSGSLTFTGPTGEWTDKITFDTPFEYNGRDSVAILWINAHNNYFFNRFEWGVVNGATGSRMLHQESDAIDVEDMTAFRSSILPQTKLYY